MYMFFYLAGLLPLARRIEEWLDNGVFTVGEMRSAFGKDNPEFNAFRARVKALRDCDDLIQNAEGE